MKKNINYSIGLFILTIMLGSCTSSPGLRQTPISTIDLDISPSQTATPYPVFTTTLFPTSTTTETAAPTPAPTLYPLSIPAMRNLDYPGSPLTIEQELPPGFNYSRKIVSYKSEDLKIYALLTIPFGERPASGWPVIIFNHGFIPPDQYRTTERYVNYVDRLARAGFIIFRSDYRGHDNSEGKARGAYGYPDYVIDVLNGFQSMKSFPDADPDRIGMWGHSMGGYLTLRSMVIMKDIKAGVIWAGVVGSYPDILTDWPQVDPPLYELDPSWRTRFVDEFGSPAQNPVFWDSISSTSYLEDISGPLQLHHSLTDEVVPFEFSNKLFHELIIAGKITEFYAYQGDNHNISYNFTVAMDRTIDFFNRYVKGE
jgi:dipeptidyl aminopeptidase/acylaminoacyl peptidase